MIDPHIANPNRANPNRANSNRDAQECAGSDAFVPRSWIADVSADFGEGALAVSCSCGAWAVESESGELLAWSTLVVTSSSAPLLEQPVFAAA